MKPLKRRTLFSILCIAGLATLMSGCEMVILQPVGRIAMREKHLIIVATVLMLLVVVPVILLTLAFAYRYRASNTRASYKPDWAESPRLELVFWSIPCVIVIALATITWKSTHELDPYKVIDNSKTPLIIQAVALDWKWLFIYPKSRIATINYLEIPANKPVEFMLTADAPMNALEIPRIAGQIYAMGGMRTRLNLIVGKTGTYHGLSTSFSGEGFSDMNFIVKVSSADQFRRWTQHIKKLGKPLTWATYNKLTAPSEHNHAEYFSTVSPKMFYHVIAKYTKPSAHNKQIASLEKEKKKVS